jgi:hypothetical protein
MRIVSEPKYFSPGCQGATDGTSFDSLIPLTTGEKWGDGILGKILLYLAENYFCPPTYSWYCCGTESNPSKAELKAKVFPKNSDNLSSNRFTNFNLNDYCHER